jgi:hypothetical protein
MIVHAWAEDLLSHFQTIIDIQEEYNNNINLTPNRFKQDDFITTVTPGFKISTSPRSPVTGQFRSTPTAEEKYGIDLDFRAGFNFYAKHHEENYISLNGNLNAWYALSKNLNFRVRDYLIRSNDIREPDYSATAIQGQYLPSRIGKRTTWIRNVFEPSLQYEFGRIDASAIDTLTINYRNNVYNIQSNLYEDTVEHYINPRITYWFNIRHGVSLEYGLDLGNFQRSPDVMGHMVTGRYTYRFNPNTSIFVEYSQAWRDFDSLGNDYITYRPSIGVQHAFSPTLNLNLQAGYYLSNPKVGSNVDGFFGNFLLSQQTDKTTYTLSFQAGYSENFFTGGIPSYSQNIRVLGRISHQLLEKMNVAIYASYEWNKYYRGRADISSLTTGTGRQQDNIWSIGGDASYQLLKWLTLSLGFSHSENRSNIDGADYSEYRGIFKITATY